MLRDVVRPPGGIHLAGIIHADVLAAVGRGLFAGVLQRIRLTDSPPLFAYHFVG